VTGADEVDEDAIYRQVGRFVVSFQLLQTQLVSLASLATDPDSAGWNAQNELWRLWFTALVDRTGEAVAEFTKTYRGEVPEFQERVDHLLDRCRELARYRNKIVHSAYAVMEGGGRLVAIVRTDTRTLANDPDNVDQEALNEKSFNTAMVEIAHVGFELGLCHRQLIGWYDRDRD
jgi:hypothetical protein